MFSLLMMCANVEAQWTTYNNGIVPLRIICSGSNLWVLAFDQLVRIDIRTGAYHMIRHGDINFSLAYTDSLSIAIGSFSKGNGGSAFAYANDTSATYRLTDSSTVQLPWQENGICIEDNKGRRWIGQTGRIRCIDGAIAHDYAVIGRGDLLATPLLYDSQGRLWFYQGGDLYYINGTNVISASWDGNPVKSLYEDRHGFFWATEGFRLWKRDGAAGYWEYIPAPSETAGNFIENIIGDSAENIWLSGSSTWKYDGKTWTTYPQIVGPIMVDSSGQLWARERYRNNPNYFQMYRVVRMISGQWKYFPIGQESLASTIVANLFLDNDSTVWATTQGNGLGKFYNGQWTFYSSASSALPSDTTTILKGDNFIESTGAFWFMSGNRLVRWNGAEFIDQGVSLADRSCLMGISNSQKKWLWNDSLTLLYTQKSGAWVPIAVPSQIIGNHSGGTTPLSIKTISIDSSDNLWIGNDTTFLYCYNGITWKSYAMTDLGFDSISRQDQFNEANIAPVCDRSGQVWALCSYYGDSYSLAQQVSFQNSQTQRWEHISSCQSLFANEPLACYPNSIQRCIVDNRNVLWLSMGWESLVQIDNGSVTGFGFSSSGPLNCWPAELREVVSMADGKSLVSLCYNNYSFITLSCSTGTCEKIPDLNANVKLIDRSGRYWGFAGSEGSVICYDRGYRTVLTPYNSGIPCGLPTIEKNRIISILQDRTGDLWFLSTTGGLARYRPGDNGAVHRSGSQNHAGGLSLAAMRMNAAQWKIAYTIPFTGTAQLALYDLRGRQIAHLMGSTVKAGAGTVLCDLSRLPSGIYALRLTCGRLSVTRPIQVMAK